MVSSGGNVSVTDGGAGGGGAVRRDCCRFPNDRTCNNPSQTFSLQFLFYFKQRFFILCSSFMPFWILDVIHSMAFSKA